MVRVSPCRDRHFAHWIKSHFEKLGHQAVLEWVIPGTTHPVDVAVQAGSSWEVFEICITASDNVASHIEACLAPPGVVKRVVIVTGTNTELKGLQKPIQPQLPFLTHTGQEAFDVIENYLT